MKMSLVLVLFSLMTIYVLPAASEGSFWCYSLNAVYTFKGIQYFIYGNNWMVGIDFNGNVQSESHVIETGYPYFVQAAVGHDDWNAPKFFFETGIYETGYDDFNAPATELPLYWSGAIDDIFHDPEIDHIDAAFQQPNSTFVYIAGCKYVKVDFYHMNYFDEGNVTDFNLPCHPDAAWASPNHEIAMITKGRFLWEWHAETNEVKGPTSIFAFFSPLAKYLCPGF